VSDPFARPALLPKARWFWPVFATILLTDCTTKQLVVSALGADPGPHPLIGNLLRVTLAYNADAAFSFSFASASRIIFSAIACGALGLLFQLYRRTRADGVLRAAALALVAGGALGNLLDRLRSARGVVDFIDIGMGSVRFWIFNVADLGVTLGALLLVVVLWREERAGEVSP
jgi:signal peptidase II